MHRFAWKNRVTLGLGVGIASLVLVAGCADDDEPEDDLGINDPIATETVATDPTETATETTATTPTATEGSDDPGEAEDVAVTVTADGLMMDGTATSDLSLTSGSTVTFLNDGTDPVALATDDGTIDEEIEAGDSFEHTFDEAGTWTLTVDGTEVGIITVQ